VVDWVVVVVEAVVVVVVGFVVVVVVVVVVVEGVVWTVPFWYPEQEQSGTPFVNPQDEEIMFLERQKNEQLVKWRGSFWLQRICGWSSIIIGEELICSEQSAQTGKK
jgi:hypothetical protein